MKVEERKCSKCGEYVVASGMTAHLRSHRFVEQEEYRKIRGPVFRPRA